MNVNTPNDRPERSLTPLRIPRESSDGDRLAALDEEEVAAEGGAERAVDEGNENEKEEKVTWASLPHRRQLIILTLARLSEPLVQTSLQVGSFYPRSRTASNLSMCPGIYVLPAQILR